jgi:hypothetical protein
MLRTFVPPILNADRYPCDIQPCTSFLMSLSENGETSLRESLCTPVSMITSWTDAPHQPSAVSDFRWFAVRCRHGMETLVDFKLRTMLIETLLPLAKESTRQPRRTSGSLASPLFAGYLFANFCTASSLRAVALSRRSSTRGQQEWRTGSGKRGNHHESASARRVGRIYRTW